MELPMTNISRNFPGVDQNQYYTIEDICNGDYGGSTDTDSKTDDSYAGKNYSTVYNKAGKVR